MGVIQLVPDSEIALAAIRRELAIGRGGVRRETDSIGEVEVRITVLWRTNTALTRRFQHRVFGYNDLIPREMIAGYATLRRAAQLQTTTEADEMSAQAYQFFIKS